MSRLSDAIARYVRTDRHHHRQIRRGVYVKPLGLRRGLVKLGACGQVIAGDRLSDLEPGASVLVADDGPRVILSAPPALAGPRSSAARKLAGSPALSAAITITVTVINDDSGTLAPEDFELFVDGAPTSHLERHLVAPGVHTLTYNLPAGYTAGPWGGDADPGGSITVAAHQQAAATITFDDVAPASLTITDVVACDEFGPCSGGNPPDAKHKVTSGIQHRFEIYLSGGDLLDGDNIEITIINTEAITFFDGVTKVRQRLYGEGYAGSPSCGPDPGLGGSGGIEMIGTSFLDVDSSVPQGTKVRLKVENLRNGAIDERDTLTVEGTGLPATC